MDDTLHCHYCCHCSLSCHNYYLAVGLKNTRRSLGSQASGKFAPAFTLPASFYSNTEDPDNQRTTHDLRRKYQLKTFQSKLVIRQQQTTEQADQRTSHSSCKSSKTQNEHPWPARQHQLSLSSSMAKHLHTEQFLSNRTLVYSTKNNTAAIGNHYMHFRLAINCRACTTCCHFYQTPNILKWK